MRIFVIIDHWFPNVGGGLIHVAELARRTQNDQFRISIITSRLNLYKPYSSLVSYPDLEVVRLGPTGNFGDFTKRLKFLISLLIYLLTHDFDVLHVHPFFPIPIAWFVCFVKRKPIVVTIHGIGQNIRGVSFSLAAELLKQINNFITFHIPYTAQIFVNKNNLSIKNINKQAFYIPNGVDMEMFDKVEDRKGKREVILFIGRFAEEKNIISLIHAFCLITKTHKEIKLKLVGDGDQKNLINREIKKLNLTKKIQILQPVFGSKLIRLYKSSSILILPSKYEAFPLTILEAWAAKLAVIVTSVGMVPNIITNGVNGIIIDGFESMDIAGAIDNALKNKKLKNLGEKGYNLVSQRYTWDIVAEKTLSVYKNIIQYEKN